jgi:probable rRNA maturation factor
MLALTFVGGDWTADLKEPVQRVLAAVLATELATSVDGTINLKLVDDATIANLNEQSTGKHEATDVLTFNYREDGEPADGELADIAISLETAARQAKAATTELPNEVALLALHGILHTLGHDHQEIDAQHDLDQLQHDLMDAAGLTYREFAWHQ